MPTRRYAQPSLYAQALALSETMDSIIEMDAAASPQGMSQGALKTMMQKATEYATYSAAHAVTGAKKVQVLPSPLEYAADAA